MKTALGLIGSSSIVTAGVMLCRDGTPFRVSVGVSLLALVSGVLLWAVFDTGRDYGRGKKR